MTDLRQAAQQALETLEEINELSIGENAICLPAEIDTAMDAIRTALEQQAEPSQWRDMVVVNLVREGVNKHKARELADHFATLPQQQDEPVVDCPRCGHVCSQRQWVGLTDEDVNRESAHIAQQMKLAFHAGMYVAQQILKEKNNG